MRATLTGSYYLSVHVNQPSLTPAHVLFLGSVQLLFAGNLPTEWMRLNRPLM